jgi:hypothetical protein
MEATSHIRRLLALGTIWNVNLNDCSGAETLLRHAMGWDECRLPLDACPTLGAVQLLVSIVKAGGHQEQSFVRDKIVNADMTWCLQSALTFQRFDFGHKTCEA